MTGVKSIRYDFSDGSTFRVGQKGNLIEIAQYHGQNAQEMTILPENVQILMEMLEKVTKSDKN